MNAGMKPLWQAWNFRALALCLVVLLHGAFSSPAPKTIGPAEILIVIGLIIAILPQLPGFLSLEKVMAQPATLAWLWMLFVPMIIAVIAGHDLRDLGRDLIAVCFLGLPVLIGKIETRHIKHFALAIAVAGTLLALRYWVITDGFSALHYLKARDNLLYLALDPMMLFAGIYCPILLIENFFSAKKLYFKITILIITLAAAILCWGAMGGMMMRGALVLGMASLGLYGLRYWRKPGVAMMMVILALAVLIIFAGPLLRFIMALWEKTEAVGLNARDAEFAAIWKLQSADPMAFLFGRGWGALFSSPAVGGYWVNYSHSAFGFYFLKTGILGLMIIGIYLLQLLWPLRRVRNVILFAALPPVILSFTLYTSYKFFGCGVILLLLSSLYAHSDPQPR